MTLPEPLPELLSGEQVSRLLHCSPRTVSRYARDGRIVATRVGRKLLYTRDSIAKTLEANRVIPASK